MKILVATDGSPNARACVSTLKNRSSDDDSHIEVIGIYDSVQSRFFSKRLSHESAQELVDETVDFLSADHPKSTVSGNILEGHPVTKILELAEKFQPDYIFVGAHARGSWAEEFLGSVADEVLRRSHSSVVVVRADPDGAAARMRKHLLCFDDTPVTTGALVALEKRIWPARAELKVLHVVLDPEQEGSHNVDIDVQLAEARLAKIRAQMQEKTDAQVAALKRLLPDNDVSGLVVDEEAGGTVDTILAVASDWQADLIAMGSHQRKGVDRFWLGSVSEAVAAHALCSVEIIRPLTSAEPGE